MTKLIEHLNECHEKGIEITLHHFNNMDDFNEWKKGDESLSKSFYVRYSASRMQGINRKTVISLVLFVSQRGNVIVHPRYKVHVN